MVKSRVSVPAVPVTTISPVEVVMAKVSVEESATGSVPAGASIVSKELPPPPPPPVCHSKSPVVVSKVKHSSSLAVSTAFKSASVTLSSPILKTPALVRLMSPDGTTGLKFVPSAINRAVSVLVPKVILSPETVRLPVIFT